MTPPLAQQMDDFIQRLDTIDPVHISTVFYSLLDMIDGVNRPLDMGTEPTEDEHEGEEDPRAVKIKSYILKNLSKTSLGVETLCQEFKVSRSTLYNLLRPDGGVAEYILAQRASHCRLALVDPAYKNYGVMGIAQKFGFSNHAHFSRVFRKIYGTTPSQWRVIGA